MIINLSTSAFDDDDDDDDDDETHFCIDEAMHATRPRLAGPPRCGRAARSRRAVL